MRLRWNGAQDAARSGAGAFGCFVIHRRALGTAFVGHVLHCCCCPRCGERQCGLFASRRMHARLAPPRAASCRRVPPRAASCLVPTRAHCICVFCCPLWLWLKSFSANDTQYDSMLYSGALVELEDRESVAVLTPDI